MEKERVRLCEGKKVRTLEENIRTGKISTEE